MLACRQPSSPGHIEHKALQWHGPHTEASTMPQRSCLQLPVETASLLHAGSSFLLGGVKYKEQTCNAVATLKLAHSLPRQTCSQLTHLLQAAVSSWAA